MALFLALGWLLVGVLGFLLWNFLNHTICVCPSHPVPSHVVFTNQEGEQVMDVKLKIGETKSFHAKLLRDDNTIDDSFENPEWSYENGENTAPDGSSSSVENGLDVTITGLQASPIDDAGQPVRSPLQLQVDSATGEEAQLISGVLLVYVVEDNATHVEFDEITPV